MRASFKIEGSVVKKLTHTLELDANQIAELIKKQLIAEGFDIPEGEEYFVAAQDSDFSDEDELKALAQKTRNLSFKFVVYEEDEEEYEG